MISSLLLVVLCIGCALAVDVSFQAGVNVSAVSDNGWQYRKVSLTTWISAWGRGASYLSVGAQKQPGQLTADIVSGAAYYGIDYHPFSYIAYFNGSLEWTLNETGVDTWATSSDFSTASGYVGAAYLALEETTPNGTVVAVQNLRGAVIASANGGVQWSFVDHSAASANLKYVTISGSTSASWSVDITFIAASVAGVLNQSETVVGPKNFESIIQIQDYPYQSSSNSLSLLIGVGTGSATYSGTGRSIISASGAAQVYFTANDKVTTENGNTDVAVSISTNATSYISDDYFSDQLTAKYGASASYHIVTVTFPAGASNIIYDPSTGAGQPMEDASPSSSSFAVKTEVASLFLFALLLVFL